MTSPDVNYFLARGRSLELITAWQAEALAYRAWADLLVSELGASRGFYLGLRLCGFAFQTTALVNGEKIVAARYPAPEHAKRLRLDRETRGMWVPNRRTNAGKALNTRMNEGPPCPRRHALTNDLIGTSIRVGYTHDGAERVHGIGGEPLGGDWIISVPVGTPWSPEAYHDPPDAEPMKRSEYWLRKEAAEEAA